MQDIKFFANCPVATWPQFGEMLSWQFLSATKRGLNDDQLEMIAYRMFGKSYTISFSSFTYSVMLNISVIL